LIAVSPMRASKKRAGVRRARTSATTTTTARPTTQWKCAHRPLTHGPCRLMGKHFATLQPAGANSVSPKQSKGRPGSTRPRELCGPVLTYRRVHRAGFKHGFDLDQCRDRNGHPVTDYNASAPQICSRSSTDSGRARMRVRGATLIFLLLALIAPASSLGAAVIGGGGDPSPGTSAGGLLSILVMGDSYSAAMGLAATTTPRARPSTATARRTTTLGNTSASSRPLPTVSPPSSRTSPATAT
jgi:hypothetical protein